MGIVIGYFIFFRVGPETPKIAIIDIPFTIITEDSAFVISAFLDYARQRDDIKGVVIKLNSPGSSGAAGEQVYRETRKLREKKPVVIAIGDLTASGAYKWSLGANYTYAKSGSWVGSVGVFITFPGPLIPTTPDDQIISTGPGKLTAGGRRQFVRILEQLKENFYQTVVSERGEKLRLSREQLMEARIYNGNEAARLGLVDAVGGDSEAIEKAASLAGISDYGFVDVNTEVFRIFTEKFVRIFEPLFEATAETSSVGDMLSLMAVSRGTGTGDPSSPLDPL